MIVSYPGFSSILLNYTGANSHYNSLQAEGHGKVTHDLQRTLMDRWPKQSQFEMVVLFMSVVTTGSLPSSDRRQRLATLKVDF